MVVEEEYEIMPHRTLQEIKDEVDQLKDMTASKDKRSQKEFKSSIKRLNDNITVLLDLFKEAGEGVKEEKEEEEDIKGNLEFLKSKIEKIEEENKTIAKGIVTVADMIKDWEKKQEEEKPDIPVQKHIPKPKFNIPGNMNMPSSTPQQQPQAPKNISPSGPVFDEFKPKEEKKETPNIPPPPAPERKKGFFEDMFGKK